MRCEISLAIKINESAFKMHVTLLNLLGSKIAIKRDTLLLGYTEFFNLFSSAPKPKGKKAKDMKKSVKVPDEQQAVVGQSHIDIFLIDLV